MSGTEKYHVMDACVISPDGSHALFDWPESTVRVCKKLNDGSSAEEKWEWTDAKHCPRHGKQEKPAPEYRVEGTLVFGPDGMYSRFGSDRACEVACNGLNSGKVARDCYMWWPAEEQEEPDEDLGPVQASTVFRDQDWGLGMFDKDAPYTVVVDGEIWLMLGHDSMLSVESPAMNASEARSIANILLAAADNLEECGE